MAEKKIGQNTYRVAPMRAPDALALYVDLMRIGTKAANRLPAIIFALQSEDNADMADVAALLAIQDILASTSTDSVMDLLNRIVTVAEIRQSSGTYTPVDLDREFSGKLNEIIPVARFVIMEQFSDFFIGSGESGILGLLKATLRNRK